MRPIIPCLRHHTERGFSVNPQNLRTTVTELTTASSSDATHARSTHMECSGNTFAHQQPTKPPLFILYVEILFRIIEPVPEDTITPWCARMAVTPETNGDPRQTVDLQNLNKATSPRHHTPRHHTPRHHTPNPFKWSNPSPLASERM